MNARPLQWRRPNAQDHDMGLGSADQVADGIGGRYSIERQNDGSALLWWAHDAFQWESCASVNDARFKAEDDWQDKMQAIIRSPEK